MKKERAFLVIVLGFLLLLSLVSLISAAVTKGNMNNSIVDTYGPGENLRGWINITLSPTPFNAAVTAFSSSVTLGDFLDSAGVDYNCSNNDCGMDYAVSSEDPHTFTLNAGENKTIGVKIIAGNILDINSFVINLTSGGSGTTESCRSPLIADIFDTGNSDYLWSSENIGSTYCGTKNYGCYISSQGTPMPGAMQANTPYCEEITFEPGKVFQIGADVNGTGTGNFQFSVGGAYCPASTSSSGSISCDLNLSIPEQITQNVCAELISGNYRLLAESNSPSPCGFINDAPVSSDFSIFAQKKKYAPLGNFIIDLSDSSYQSNILSYIDTKYQSDCSSGCYIPVKLTSNIDGQLINVNGMSLFYNSNTSSAATPYILASTPATISIPKFTKIDLSQSGLLVPNSVGVQTLNLRINGEDVVTNKRITILNLPTIDAIYPTEVPAGANVKFTLAVSGANLTSFRWNFGDNTSAVETSKPYTTHEYASAELKSYTIQVTARNNLGSINKTFVIKTVSPGGYLVTLIADYKSRVALLKKQIASYPDPVKNAIEAKINLSSNEIAITQIQTDYNNSAGSTTKYISLLNQLYSINLPNSINITQKSSGKFIIDESLIKSADLASVTGSEVTATDASAQNAVFAWFLKSLDISTEINVYSSIESNISSPLFTYAKITIKPLTSASSNIYGIMPLSQDKINYISATPTSNGALTSFPVDLSSGAKTVEMVISDDNYILALPVYFTPAISQLQFSLALGSCNHNKICEATLGETTANCGDDCKPTGRIAFFFILLIILFLAAYIGLQEWYNKKYENWLFKDKNDLFNLVSFMENAEKQGLKKDEIFGKLREKKWAFEQVSYAYKKFKGMRTGMFEIPIFTLFDKAKLLKTISLKKKIGTEQKTAPEPKTVFKPGMPGRPSVIPFVSGDSGASVSSSNKNESAPADAKKQ